MAAGSARVTVKRAISFTAFCARLGVVLEPGQLVFCLVAFDGVEPRDLKGQQRELAREMFGPDVDVVPPLARSVIVMVAGGRGGKSYLFALRALHLGLTVDLSTIAPGQQPAVTFTAPDQSLALEDVNYIRGAIRSNPDLLAMAVSGCEEDSKSLELVVRRGPVLIKIAARAAGAKGRTGRGRSLLCGGLDECAFFFDEDHKVSDVDVFKAIRPRVMVGGQTLVGSTPWGEEGLLWDLYVANWNRPTTCLVAHAPTTLLRSNPDILSMVAAETARDPENAAREFGAQFMKTTAAQFFDGATLDLIFHDDPPAPAPPGSFITAGGDLAFSKNSSALATVYCLEETYEAMRLEERRPADGHTKPSLVCKEFAALARKDGAEGIMADGYYAASAVEHFEEEAVESGLRPVYRLAAPTGEQVPETFVRARTLAREGRLRVSNKLPLAARLRSQMKAVRSRPLAGGRVSIGSKERADGSHGDVLSALVLAVWQQYGAEVPHAKPALGSPAYYAAQEAELEERLIEQHGRQGDWQDGGQNEWQ